MAEADRGVSSVLNPWLLRPSHCQGTLVVPLAFLLLGVACEIVAAENVVNFDKTVAPLIAGRCLSCHSGGDAKGGLDLSREKKVLAGGDSGAALTPGKLGDSLLWQRISKDEMPPKRPLSDSEKNLLKAWIISGAKWGTDPIDPYRFTSGTRAGADWWSLQPLQRVNPPQVNRAVSEGFVRNPIDAFVAAGLSTRKLNPNPPANRETLIRRWYFDLIGLPPTPAEVRQFVEDKTSGAEERLVRKLLDSPHYGERWARHWLDVAHFGESDGFEYDRMRPHAWRYRDWVIQSLNRDLPYNEFARLQIAGDVLHPRDSKALIATGFLVAGAFDSLVPAGDEMRQIMRQDELEDIVGIVGQTFLGLTINCARCHDHKFDPIRQRDYYRLASALAGVKRGEHKLLSEPVPELLARHIQRLERQVSELEEPVRAAILERRSSKRPSPPKPPRPFASWNFNNDLRDSIGNVHGTAEGNVKLDRHRLILDGGRTYVTTAPLSQDLIAKTLEAWVRLDYLEQRGGGVIGVQTLDEKSFDTLTYGGKEARKWEATTIEPRQVGSFDGPAETAARDRTVHLALVYEKDGKVTAYRDGIPYGQSLQRGGILRFPAGKARVLFGVRQLPAGRSKHLAGFIERANLYDRALSPAEVAASASRISQYVSDEEITAGVSTASAGPLKSLRIRLAAAREQARQLTEAAAFAVTPQKAPVTHVLRRGSHREIAEVVSAGGLEVLQGSGSDFGLAPDASDANRRIRLANWVASEKNPLFARTIVNRIWYYHFGRGLIDTPNDLGFSGGQPSHHELLDWLASELIRSGWSLKELHRIIVLSGTYRQSSASQKDAIAVDSDNRFLWRYAPRRLDAESLRDSVLNVSGTFNSAAGGPSFQDFRPFFHRGSQFYEMLDPVGEEYNRRSIYRMWVRGGRNPLLDAFDCPDPSTTAPKRGNTTTPLQSLSLMNNSFMLRMSDHFADRLKREAGDKVEAQLRLGFELTWGRPPRTPELETGIEFVRHHGLAPFCRALLNSNGFLYVR